MAELSFTIPKSLMDQLEKAGNTSKYAPKMLEAEMDETYPEVMRRLSSHHRSGGLEKSIKKTKPKMDKNGIWRSQIKPSGYDERGIPNNRKMLAMEYGTSKQVASPVLRPAKAATESKAKEAAQQVFNEAVTK